MTRHLFDFLSQLRFPYLFAVTAIVFLLDLFIPDLVPMADEILLGLGAILLVRIWICRKKQEEAGRSRKKKEHTPGVGVNPSYGAKGTHFSGEDSHTH